MNTFSVTYVGQLRFVECLSTHYKFFKDSYVSASITPTIVESWDITPLARHSVYPDKLLDDSIDNLKSNTLINKIHILTDTDYVDYDNHSIDFFPCNYFFTFAKNCESIKTDYVILMTTDLIFFDLAPQSLFQDSINQHTNTTTPTVYANVVDENDITIGTHIIYLNAAAVECVKANWKYALETYLGEEHPFKLRNEYATWRLFHLCGINCFESLRLPTEIVRFRANMNFENLNILSSKQLLAEYRKIKQIKLSERWTHTPGRNTIKVVIGDKKIKIDKIIAFGCSFTAGAELLDHIIHRDSDLIKTKHGATYWKEKYVDKAEPHIIKRHKKLEPGLAWAGQIAKKLNISFESRAQGGSSLAWSLMKLEEAILNGDITPTTLVLFGVTTKERGIHISMNKPSPQSYLLGHPNWWPDTSWDEKTVTSIFNDGQLLWQHLLCLDRIVQLSEDLGNRLQVFEMIQTIRFEDSYSIHPDIVNILKYKYENVCKHRNVHASKSLLELCESNSKNLHGSGHPKADIHEQYADYILRNIIKYL